MTIVIVFSPTASGKGTDASPAITGTPLAKMAAPAAVVVSMSVTSDTANTTEAAYSSVLDANSGASGTTPAAPVTINEASVASDDGAL